MIFWQEQKIPCRSLCSPSTLWVPNIQVVTLGSSNFTLTLICFLNKNKWKRQIGYWIGSWSEKGTYVTYMYVYTYNLWKSTTVLYVISPSSPNSQQYWSFWFYIALEWSFLRPVAFMKFPEFIKATEGAQIPAYLSPRLKTGNLDRASLS